jgi:hypothetical protein
VCVAVTTLAGSSPASAHNTVVFDEAGPAAPHIGLVGDSTLAGVRWWGKYGDLRQYNFVLDAESCRRTLEQSCWSREDFRPDNTVLAVQRLAGELGEVLVVMSGYNDKSMLFDDAVDAVVAEARRQAIPHVMWLTLRTDVTYQDPQERASADGYREDNRVLYEKAEQLGGYLQIADWATHSADRSGWFFGDGVHLTTEGVTALTSFIAEHVGIVLAGGSLNPAVVPWATLEEGDTGTTVAEVQEALLAAGLTGVGVADGVYGEQTTAAVTEFQRSRGFTVTGAVEEPTAIALGVHGAPEPVAAPAPAPAPPRPAPAPEPIVVAASSPVDERSVPNDSLLAGVTLGLGVMAAAALLVQRRRRPSVLAGEEEDAVPITPAPYDHELEDALSR